MRDTLPVKQPYAQVVVDVEPMHLDRLFDYAVPEALSPVAVPGTRVRVKFAGRRVDGYIRALSEVVDRPERVQPLSEVVGVPVVTPDVFDLCRAVADRYVGTLPDVLRSAVPNRHARTEAAIETGLPIPPVPAAGLPDDRLQRWRNYLAGEQFLANLAAGGSPRAALAVAAVDSGVDMALDAVQQAAAAGRGALLVVPDYRDLAAALNGLGERLGDTPVVALHSGQKPAERYAAHLRLLRGEAKIAVGTRAAAFAPVADLGLVVILDDGDDLFAEQHSPYWNAREVLALRSQTAEVALLAVSASRSVEVQQWIESGWAVDLVADRDFYRRSAPIVRAVSDADLARDPVARAARLPAVAFTALRQGLHQGPVLVQVPRRGYQLNLRCDRCRRPALCPECEGPLQRSRPTAVPVCTRCGATSGDFKCRTCSATELRAGQIGAARTAEEIARAFPDIRLITSGRDAVVAEIEDSPALVICTPGAEPIVRGGRYQAAVILDAELTLNRADLRAFEEAFRRWQSVCGLVTPTTGTVLVAADDTHPVLQALIRQDPIGFAVRELAARRQAGLTPAAATFEWLATAGVWSESAATINWPAGVRVLGPVGIERDQEAWERVLINAPRSQAAHVAEELRAVLGRRASSKAVGNVQIRRDPVPLR